MIRGEGGEDRRPTPHHSYCSDRALTLGTPQTEYSPLASFQFLIHYTSLHSSAQIAISPLSLLPSNPLTRTPSPRLSFPSNPSSYLV